MQCLGRRICDGAADAAADHNGALDAFDFGRVAERADNVGQAIAFVHGCKHFGRAANRLENNRDGAFRPVIIGDGERYAFPVIVDPEDDKLSCFCLRGNVRRIDLHKHDLIVERPF